MTECAYFYTVYFIFLQLPLFFIQTDAAATNDEINDIIDMYISKELTAEKFVQLMLTPVPAELEVKETQALKWFLEYVKDRETTASKLYVRN